MPRKSKKLILKRKIEKISDKKIDKKNEPIGIVSKMREKINKKNMIETKLPIKFKEYGTYIKKEKVDYDVVIMVSSHDRYEKVDRILKQIFSQETRYSFKLILMNDGSTDDRYNELKNKYSDIQYLKNETPGGKINYWRTINRIFSEIEKINTHAVIQLDDDFILCDDFLNRIIDEFFRVKELSNNYMIFGFHIYTFSEDDKAPDWWFNENEIIIDGGFVMDTQFLKKIDYKLDDIERRVRHNTSSFVWVRICEHLIELGMRVYRCKNSLVWHDGNDDSKLHPKVRSKKRVYTKNFIDIDKVDYKQ